MSSQSTIFPTKSGEKGAKKEKKLAISSETTSLTDHPTLNCPNFIKFHFKKT